MGEKSIKKTKTTPEKPKNPRRIKKRYVSLALIVIASLIILTKLWSESTIIFLDVSSDSMDITLKNLKTDYKEKAAIIPVLVGTIKSESDFEGNILVNVTNAMAVLLKDTENREFILAVNELDSSLDILFSELDGYRKLNVNTRYNDLINSLGTIDTKTTEEITFYNSVAEKYNDIVKSFPTKLIANKHNYTTRLSFQ
ncbi:MAG: LemA family protein [Nanoarchaeota archaeon]